MGDTISTAREYRERLFADTHRPAFHFTITSGSGHPGDPNGAFFADGVYHLMYLYRHPVTNGFHWGHVSSRDLLHWTHHPDALTVCQGDGGCYSGGAFVDEDGTAYLSFWKKPTPGSENDCGAIALACAKSPYVHWDRMEPFVLGATEYGICEMLINGKTVYLASADPSNIWKMNGHYYIQTGNKRVLDQYGREETSMPEYRGAWTDLLRSDDLRHWTYIGRFYDHLSFPKNADWPDETEDDMCPSFLPLYDAPSKGNFTGKYLQLFISHNKGCQYFVGELKGETFLPQYHGRMSRANHDFFAPEALVDDKNRHIMWAWLHDFRKDDYPRFGWAGVYSFPRLLWWKDEQLHMAPAEELEQLQFHHQVFPVSGQRVFPVVNGACFRLRAVWKVAKRECAGFRVRANQSGTAYTEIYVDREAGTLVLDTTHSGGETVPVKEELPFLLKKNESLRLDIFVDRSVVEVYANNRQAICRQIFPEDPSGAVGVSAIGNVDSLLKLEAWELFPSNPC